MNTPQTITRFEHAIHPELQEILAQLTANLARPQELLRLGRDFSLGGDYPHAHHCYSRTILHREPGGSEVMVARWDVGALTPIHGHPRYAFVYVLQGQLQIENFRKTENGLLLSECLIKGRGQYIYTEGAPDRYDNAIHRVTALVPSLSLHVYSDDALKGETYA